MKPTDTLLFATVLLVWAFNFVAAKVGLGQLPPLLFLALRFTLVVMLLAPFLRRRGVPVRRVAGISVTLGTFHFGLLMAGLSGVDAGPAAVAAQLFVPFGVLLGWLVYGERLRLWQLTGMAVAFLGIYVLAGEPRVSPSLIHLGMVVAAAFALAVATIQIKKLGPIDIFTLNAWIALFALPQVAAGSILLEQDQLAKIAAADWRGWGAVAYGAVGGTIVGHGLWYHLVRKYPVKVMMPPTLLNPVLAMGLAVWLLGEPLTLQLVLGAALVLGGVGVIHLFRLRDAPVMETEPR